ncbi:TPA: hypothetical protein DEO28_01415 [Candidatus Dependentiae bacterium]|nr:MAG: hypothetical protein UR14_C0003G0131 [candidate division TM6 bacterium GW2011_GWE2_31_21]KKP53705.1 MAG: hypothetical protein UR43_C0003G0026 [candidate division TM6 bacterium GW2011_GWF2_33_332]HBS48543.1 hypothetical protein [Candidatus Dependentiae bacterium]HBZ73158.1 hypothetical protein [Candidatus Dependentiae bacterium]
MILGIGTDIVENSRFSEWKSYSDEKLSSIFSPEEINFLMANPNLKTEQYFASRFAAKEAFFKSLSNTLIHLKLNSTTFSFQFARKHVEVILETWDIPTLKIDWKSFEEKIDKTIPQIKTDLSISHEKNYSIAFVILSL